MVKAPRQPGARCGPGSGSLLRLGMALGAAGSLLASALPAAAQSAGMPTEELVREAIAQGLAAWLGAHDARAEFVLVASPAFAAPHASSLRSCRMRPLAFEAPPSPRLAVWVDCAAQRSVLRTITLKVWQQAWVAQRDIRVGEPLDERALTRTEADVARQGRFAWRGALGGHAARRGLLAGEVLADSNVQASTAVERGERVRLVDRRGGIEIEALAVALQAGNVGQTITARIDKATASVSALVVAPGQLEIR
jgi:flagella basal body P-ring formation protein FlgA